VALELGDEASGLALGVAAGVVVAAAAEVFVKLAGGEHVPDGAEDRVLDSTERAGVAELGLLVASTNFYGPIRFANGYRRITSDKSDSLVA
jgi:hypothetical protein